MSKRRKILLWVVGVLVAIGIAGALAGSPDDQAAQPIATMTTTMVVTAEMECNQMTGRARTLAAAWVAEVEAVATSDFDSATLAYDIAILTYDDMQTVIAAAYACNLKLERYDEAEKWAELALSGQSIEAELRHVCLEELAPQGFDCG